MHLGKAAGAHGPGADDLKECLGVAAKVHRGPGRRDEVYPPPILAQRQASRLDLGPNPVFPEAAAELVNEPFLQLGEKDLGVGQHIAGVGPADAGHAPQHLGRKADAPRNVAGKEIEKGLEVVAGMFVLELLKLRAWRELHHAAAAVELVEGHAAGGCVLLFERSTHAHLHGVRAFDDKGGLAGQLEGLLGKGHDVGHVVQMQGSAGKPGRTAGVTDARRAVEMQDVIGGNIGEGAARLVGQ